MNRVQRLKETKSNKRRFVGLAILFFSVILVGVSVVDYSFNSLMKNEKRLEIISYKSHSDSLLEVSIMNKKIYMNTKYIEKDFQKLKSKFSKIIKLR